MFLPEKPGVRQYFYVPDRLVFMLQTQAGGDVPAWLLKTATMTAEVTAPWKRLATQNLVFALIRNPPRDAVTGVALSEEGQKNLIVGYTHAIGIMEKWFGAETAEQMATEMLSRAYDGVHHEQHKGVAGSFRHMLGEGIADIPNYNEMTPMQRLAKAPGQVSAATTKLIEILNWASGGRYVSQSLEAAGRAGDYHYARMRGRSAMYAQAAFDRGKGHFIQHSRTRFIAELFRAAGFANPALQIMWQLTDRATHPDYEVRKRFWFRATPIIGGTAAMAAAFTYYLWVLESGGDDDELEKRLQRERNRSDWDRLRYWNAGPLKVPFEYGPVGALQSSAYVLTMDWLMGQPTRGGVLVDSVKQKVLDVPQVIPPHAKTLVELYYNYSFFYDRQIVNERLREAFPDAPELQTWDDTPEGYKAAGRLLNMSPEKIKYATRAVFSSLGDELTGAASRVATGGKLLGEEAADWPIVGRGIVRESRGYRSQPVKDLRASSEEFRALEQRIGDMQKRGLAKSRVAPLLEKAKQLEMAALMGDIIDGLWADARAARRGKNQEAVMATERDMTEMAVLFYRMAQGRTDDPAVRKLVVPPLVKKVQAKIDKVAFLEGRPQKQDAKPPQRKPGESYASFNYRKAEYKERKTETPEQYAKRLKKWELGRDADKAFLEQYRESPIVQEAMKKAKRKFVKHLGDKPSMDASRETKQNWNRKKVAAFKWLGGGR